MCLTSPNSYVDSYFLPSGPLKDEDRFMTVSATKTTSTAKLLPSPLNAWFVAGWDHEISAKGILARTIARPLALYRTEDGRAVALADACWHRLAPAVPG